MCTHHFCSRPIGQNNITWPHLLARDAGKLKLTFGYTDVPYKASALVPLGMENSKEQPMDPPETKGNSSNDAEESTGKLQ